MLNRRISCAALLLAAVLSISVRAEDAKPKAPASGPNLRVVEVGPEITRLDMAVKFFASADGKGPTVALVSAIHVADPSFYEVAQKLLDAQDLVLFEGVGGGHANDRETPKGRIELTNNRIRMLAILIERHKAQTKEYPSALDDLAKTAGDSRVMRDRLTRAKKDAWNHPLTYEKTAAGFTLTSSGADGKPGGEGENADLAFADQDPLAKDELDDLSALQADLADALGLTFQLHGFDTGKPNYRNADISVEQLKAKLGNNDGQANQFLQMMDGSSSMSGVVKMALGMIRGNPRMQITFKAIIMDMLATVGDDMSKLGNLQPGLQDMMKVLIDERNQVVIESLKAELAKEKPARSIAMWYGAGHMKDLEERLIDQLKYRHVASFWLPAITLDLTESDIKMKDIAGMRNMVKAMIETMKNRK